MLLSSCKYSESNENYPPYTILEDYETLISKDDNIIGVPTIMKSGIDSSLFIFDASRSTVLEIGRNGNIINQYGQRGRGPGELLSAKNIFLTNKYLYVVDPRQFLIKRYTLDNGINSSMNYGESSGTPFLPSAPGSPAMLRSENIDYQPVVTLEGNVLLSKIRTGRQHNKLFELVDWNGKHLADIGEIPGGSSFTTITDEYIDAIENREVPPYYRPNSFIINDKSKPNEYFLIYSALSKIEKYNSNGDQLWEKSIPQPAEIDSIADHFFDASLISGAENRLELRKYKAGLSTNEGDLFLATKWNAVWIHRFNNSGVLTHRYKLVSEESDLLPIFSLDISKRIIFIISEEGEVRKYSF